MIIAFHGTRRRFPAHQLKESSTGGRFSDMNVPHDGIWFSESRAEARAYGPRILRAVLDFENPFVYEAQDYADEGISGLPDLYHLEQAGYDGVIVERAEWLDGPFRLSYLPRYYAVIDPSAIKSIR